MKKKRKKKSHCQSVGTTFLTFISALVLQPLFHEGLKAASNHKNATHCSYKFAFMLFKVKKIKSNTLSKKRFAGNSCNRSYLNCIFKRNMIKVIFTSTALKKSKIFSSSFNPCKNSNIPNLFKILKKNCHC